jgi:hypothetical protein
MHKPLASGTRHKQFTTNTATEQSHRQTSDGKYSSEAGFHEESKAQEDLA